MPRLPGLALLGNQLCFEEALLERAETLVSAMDDDRGGDSAVLDLKERYPEKEVRMYDLEGHKDPNELLVAVRSGKGRTLSPERKLQLYREFQGAANKAELARRWGIDRSHLYEIVRECEQMLGGGLLAAQARPAAEGEADHAGGSARSGSRSWKRSTSGRRPSRKSSYCRSEFLAIRLKWAEIEAAELRGEAVDEEKGRRRSRR